jgi:hypothetical protein
MAATSSTTADVPAESMTLERFRGWCADMRRNLLSGFANGASDFRYSPKWTYAQFVVTVASDFLFRLPAPPLALAERLAAAATQPLSWSEGLSYLAEVEAWAHTPPTPPDDDRAYWPASEFLDDGQVLPPGTGVRYRFPDYKALHEFLDPRPEIRTRHPSPQRWTINIVDWRAYFDRLPRKVNLQKLSPEQLAKAFEEEAQRREEEARRKERQHQRSG